MPPCKWLLLIGDSNTRKLFFTLIAQLERKQAYRVENAWPEESSSSYMEGSLIRQLYHKTECLAALNMSIRHAAAEDVRSLCDVRFFDREVVLVRQQNGTLTSPRLPHCVHLSLRFLTGQGELTRLRGSNGGIAPPRVCQGSQEFRSAHYCDDGEHVEKTYDECCTRAFKQSNSCHHEPSSQTLAAYRLRAVPDALYLSHGLWHLPAKFASCSTRFEKERAFLDDVHKGGGVPVLWATNYVATHWSDAQQNYVRDEAACQRTHAAELWGGGRETPPLVNSTASLLRLMARKASSAVLDLDAMVKSGDVAQAARGDHHLSASAFQVIARALRHQAGLTSPARLGGTFEDSAWGTSEAMSEARVMAASDSRFWRLPSFQTGRTLPPSELRDLRSLLAPHGCPLSTQMMDVDMMLAAQGRIPYGSSSSSPRHHSVLMVPMLLGLTMMLLFAAVVCVCTTLEVEGSSEEVEQS